MAQSIRVFVHSRSHSACSRAAGDAIQCHPTLTKHVALVTRAAAGITLALGRLQRLDHLRARQPRAGGGEGVVSAEVLAVGAAYQRGAVAEEDGEVLRAREPGPAASAHLRRYGKFVKELKTATGTCKFNIQPTLSSQ